MIEWRKERMTKKKDRKKVRKKVRKRGVRNYKERK